MTIRVHERFDFFNTHACFRQLSSDIKCSVLIGGNKTVFMRFAMHSACFLVAVLLFIHSFALSFAQSSGADDRPITDPRSSSEVTASPRCQYKPLTKWILSISSFKAAILASLAPISMSHAPLIASAIYSTNFMRLILTLPRSRRHVNFCECWGQWAGRVRKLRKAC
jgi:hypothetical protein